MPNSTIPESFDLDVLGKFIYELNITRRQISTYPAHHPLIAQALDKAMDFLNQVLEFNPVLELGIAEDKLLLGNGVLDSNNPVFKDFAKNLFAHHIASLQISSGITREQLEDFCQVMVCDRDELAEQGGAAAVLARHGAKNIILTLINYSAFSSRELSSQSTLSKHVVKKNQATLWQRFISGMIDGTLSGEGEGDQCPIDPNWLAAALNEQVRQESEQVWKESYDTTISSFIEELAKENHPDSEEMHQFNTLINGLSKPLRRQFLRSAFRATTDHTKLTGQLAEQLQRSDLVDIIKNGSHNTQSLPTNVMTILSSLSQNGDTSVSTKVGGTSRLEQNEMRQRLGSLLSQDTADDYVPEAYQKLMEKIIKAPPSSGDNSYNAKLESDLEPLQIEKQNFDIIFMLLHLVENPPYDVLQTNLSELLDLAVETGDFQIVQRCHHQLTDLCHSAPHHQPFCHTLLATFNQPLFIDKLLNALTLWGKPSYDIIHNLLHQIGEPAIPVLLQGLATELSASLRRYYIHVLSSFEPACIEPIIKQLEDSRWYYIRNLLTILRHSNLPIPLECLEHLEHHPHPHVYQELLTLYLQIAPMRAEQVIIATLADSEAPQHLAAIQLAGKSTNPHIVAALIEALDAQPLCRASVDHKIAIVQALAISTIPQALLKLHHLLQSTSIRHPILHKRLKAIILEVIPLLPEEHLMPPDSDGQPDLAEEPDTQCLEDKS